jgi:hypothetical protein
MIFLKKSILLEVRTVQTVIIFLLQRNEKRKRKMLSRIRATSAAPLSQTQ